MQTFHESEILGDASVERWANSYMVKRNVYVLFMDEE